MATRVRSYAKVNLGLAIGPVRADGFHGLVTLYQTLALHDVVTVSARPLGSGESTRIRLTTNHPRVPVDGRNTAWRMVELALGRMGVTAEVEIGIEKRLPVQGGMGAGSANAAAALMGLERELGRALPGQERLALAAQVGSDVPLFLLGGAVLGLGRGEQVVPLPEFVEAGGGELGPVACVVAVPGVGVSTPAAFREWDRRVGEGGAAAVADTGAVAASGAVPDLGREAGGSALSLLRDSAIHDTLDQLSRTYASLYAASGCLPGRASGSAESGASGIIRTPSSLQAGNGPEKKQGGFDESDPERASSLSGESSDLAENSLLALVRTGIENDFEQVVFLQYPPLREIKRQLMGSESVEPAVYAALSGSGSALFGLYRSIEGARAAQQRVREMHPGFAVEALLTETLPRKQYWRNMFAE